MIEKPLAEGKKLVKARLVVRGLEEAKIQSDSPTTYKSTHEIVMAIAASQGWKCDNWHLKLLFYKAGSMIDIFVIPCIEVKEVVVIWKLDKVVYEITHLKIATLLSKFTLLDWIISNLGWLNPCLDFITKWKIKSIFVMHVDYFLFAGSGCFNGSVIDLIARKFTPCAN